MRVRVVRVKSNGSAKYVELSVECLRTRVRFPPAPPLFKRPLIISKLLVFKGFFSSLFPVGATHMTEKAMPRHTHVKLRGAMYYFRMRVPTDLVDHYKKQEITFSLKTKGLAEANRKAHEETLRCLDEFERLRWSEKQGGVQTMSPAEVRAVADTFIHDLLSSDELERKSGRVSRHHQTAIEVLEGYARPTLAGDYDYDDGESRRWMTKLARNHFERNSLNVSPGSDLENDLIYAITGASVTAIEAIKERGKGKIVATPENPVSIAFAPPVTSTMITEVSLSTIIEQYSREQENARNWQGKTGPENRAIYKVLLETIGDVPASKLGFSHMRAFKAALQRLPANINKDPRYRGKTIAEILGLPDVSAMSISTVNKYLTRTSSLLKWAQRHGHTAQNFADGLAISQRRTRASDARRMFETEHIEAIFKAIAERRVTTRGHAYSFHYWAPLLGYLTGARLNEIASLRVVDFQRTGDIDYISITQQNDGEKGTKTDAGIRKIPIHPALIRLGLLRYVEALRERGQPRLFAELTLTKNGYGSKITSWFSGHSSKADSFLWRDAGVKEDKLSFHSYRHTMATLLEHCGIDPVLRKRILGHSLNDDVTSGRYSKGTSLENMRDALIRAIPEEPLGDLPEYKQWSVGS